MISTDDLDLHTTCGCGWQEPYGFVPEADCPLHDNAEFVAQMNQQFGSASARQLWAEQNEEWVQQCIDADDLWDDR